jgi:DNA-binding response OmpR family regulator
MAKDLGAERLDSTGGLVNEQQLAAHLGGNMATRERVLLVDDEDLILEMLSDILRSAGYEALTARDGAEGLARARAEQPDLIILDVMMPKLDGLKVARLLKSDRNYSHIPIIILTAKAGASDPELVRQAGADCYLTKPVDADLLIRHVKRLLEPTPDVAPKERR